MEFIDLYSKKQLAIVRFPIATFARFPIHQMGHDVRLGEDKQWKTLVDTLKSHSLIDLTAFVLVLQLL